MPTKEELEVQLADALDENDKLRAELAAAREGMPTTARPVPLEPSFGMSEGERQDLELTGTSTSPFTGKVTESASDSRTDAE